MSTTVAEKCPKCNESHDEIVQFLIDAEVRRIPDGDLASEITYTRREIEDEPMAERLPLLRHCLLVLQIEDQRRRRIGARGGPMYRGRGSIPPEKISAAKGVNIVDLISRDLEIAWMRGDRASFHCPVHGDGHDRNPSLIAYEDQGSWWCFGCNSGGDQLDWVISRHGLGFREAVEALAS